MSGHFSATEETEFSGKNSVSTPYPNEGGKFGSFDCVSPHPIEPLGEEDGNTPI